MSTNIADNLQAVRKLIEQFQTFTSNDEYIDYNTKECFTNMINCISENTWRENWEAITRAMQLRDNAQNGITFHFKSFYLNPPHDDYWPLVHDWYYWDIAARLILLKSALYPRNIYDSLKVNQQALKISSIPLKHNIYLQFGFEKWAKEIEHLMNEYFN